MYYRVMILSLMMVLLTHQAVFADYPLPSGAALQRKEAIDSGGGRRDVRFYEINKSSQEVANFYRREMPRRGYTIFMDGENNIVFQKDAEIVMVVLVPDAQQTGKTMFVVTAGDTNTPALNFSGMACEDIPGIPRLPGSTCIQSIKSQTSRGRVQSYTTRAPVNEVLYFYRSNMPGQMWKLESEVDLGQMIADSGAFSSANAAGLDFGLESARQLNFIHANGTTCKIMVMDSPIGRRTMVNIIYAQEGR